MLGHYLKISFRNMRKYWPQSLISILGIAFAIACLTLSIYWIKYETSYDDFYPNSDYIYRVYTLEKQSGKVNKGASEIMGVKLQEHFPAIEKTTTFIRGQENCKTQEVSHMKMQLIYADSTFFNIFPQDFISGDIRKSLQVKNNIVLTESMAIRLFGSPEKALGQHIQTKMRDGLLPYLVTAVIKDPQNHTNLSFDALVNHDMLERFSNVPEEMQWMMFFMEVYVKFNPNSNVNKIMEESRELPSELKANPNIQIEMLPIADVRHKLEENSPFTLNFIGLFVVSGLLLLIAAVFNYFNLHFDLFKQRSRELNLRMVNGATVGQLIIQLLFELICSTSIAILVSAYLIVLICPTFSELLNLSIKISVLIPMFLLCGLVIIIVNLIIGFILFWKLVNRSISPYSKQRRSQPIYKRMALTLQFFVSIVFIIASLIVMRQMNFVNQKDLGFNNKDLVQLSGFVDYSGTLEEKLINELKSIPQVVDVSDANFQPSHEADPNYILNQISWPGCPSEPPLFNLMFVDSHFAKTYGLNMIEGDWWKEGQMMKVVVNEEAVRRMNITDPVGTVIRMPSESDRNVMANFEIAGVVKDFHTLSFRNQIQPIIFVPTTYKFNILYIRTELGQAMETIKRIKEVLPTIDSSLVDAKLIPVQNLYDELNSSEQIGLKVFSVLSIICLLISLFGVYAVALASTQRRRKEIAIRKVMGAEAKDIVYVFLKEYILQVILSGVFALPIAYLAMSTWLQDYAYRTNIPVGLLFGVIVVIILLVIVTILGQIQNAANRNPADVLKRE